MRNVWLVVISFVLFLSVNSIGNTADESKQIASVNCDALQILIDIQKQGREEAAQQFLEPLRKVNPIEFDKLIAKNDKAIAKLEAVRGRLVCD
jgi:hypothetical protein